MLLPGCKQHNPDVPKTSDLESVSLNVAAATLFPTERIRLTAAVLPEDATDKSVTWSTSNPAFATVEDGLVTAVAEGTATITATTVDGGKSATCAVTVQPVAVPEGTVDLGVMAEEEDGSSHRVFWATCNLGATSPEEYGDYFAWGETEAKTEYGRQNYVWASTGGYPKDKDELAPEHDAAYVILGENWRIPSKADWEAIRALTTWETEKLNKVDGYRVTGTDGESSIFLPFTGYIQGFSELGRGSSGNYRSRSWFDEIHSKSYYVGFNVHGWNEYKEDASPYVGQSIRPVWNR